MTAYVSAAFDEVAIDKDGKLVPVAAWAIEKDKDHCWATPVFVNRRYVKFYMDNDSPMARLVVPTD